MKEKKLVLILAQSLIGTGFFFLYVQHVRSIFENRTNVAHLTQLERESLFRREDALYYSFYKMLIEAPDFWTGLDQLSNLTTIEYPHSVNVLSRFHVLPEITIGYFYHALRSHSKLGLLSLLSCWRSDDIRMPPEYGRCEGQSLQFYLECVWLLGGLTVLTIYMYGLLLSRNVFGGIYSVASYIMFHNFASKIYERPMARENFAFPAIYLQMFYLCVCINRVTERKTHTISIMATLKLTYFTTIALLCWQFSAVIFGTQIVILVLPWSITSVHNSVVGLFTFDYISSQLIAIWLAYYYSQGNSRYFFGWHLGPLIALSIITAMRLHKKTPTQPTNAPSSTKQQKETEASVYTADLLFKIIPLTVSLSVSLLYVLNDILEMSSIAKPIENTYFLYRDLIIHWGLQAKVNFVTSISACNPDYERMDLSELWGIIENLVVKPYCLYGVVIMTKFFRKWRKSTEPKNENSEVVERAKKYILEDFLEEHHVSMSDMTKKETEAMLNDCMELFAKCDFDYDRYKKVKSQLKKEKPNEHLEFLNDIKKLKEQISEIREQKVKKSAQCKEQENNMEFNNEYNQQTDIDNIEHPGIKDSATENAKPSINCKKSSSCNMTTSSSTRTDTKDSYEDVEENTCNYRSFHYLYSFLQMAVFTFIGLNIRKLFFLCFTHGCVLGSTICSSVMSKKNRRIFWTAYLSVFLASIINPGIRNIQEEYFPSSQLKLGHDELDSMLEWIKMNTEKDAVFAGPIDIIGTVHLTTRRPIVNHAHLEMRQMSERTEQVYSVFSRQQSSDIYNHYSQLKIQYLIIALSDYNNDTGDECNLLTIWDDMQPAFRKYPQFCSELLVKNIPSFLKVYTSEYYAIIKLFSQSVQINLKYNKMPEKQM